MKPVVAIVPPTANSDSAIRFSSAPVAATFSSDGGIGGCPSAPHPVGQLLANSRSYEAKFAENPAYIQMYRTGNAYHPSHPFFMWYWGEAGRQWLGRVIVVGADHEYIPKLMGWETARAMQEALSMAGDTAPSSPEITMLHIAPMMMAEVTA